MAYVRHFFPDFMGNELLEKPEAKKLKELFHNAARGILFSNETIYRLLRSLWLLFAGSSKVKLTEHLASL